MLLADILLDDAQPALAATLGMQGRNSITLVHAEATAPTAPRTSECALIFLNEEKAKVVPGRETDPVDSIWYLDTGASNHMTRERASFLELDEAVHASVR
jgi:hypothetical protein